MVLKYGYRIKFWGAFKAEIIPVEPATVIHGREIGFFRQRLPRFSFGAVIFSLLKSLPGRKTKENYERFVRFGQKHP